METTIDYRLVFSLMSGRVNTELNRRLNQNFSKAGIPLNAEQWNVLLTLLIHQIATQQQLGAETSLSKTSINRIVNQLEEIGIAERFKSRVDWRSNYVRITHRGFELCDRARLVASKTLRDSLRGLSIADINVTQATLNSVMENLRASEHVEKEKEEEINNLMKHVQLHKQMIRQRRKR